MRLIVLTVLMLSVIVPRVSLANGVVEEGKSRKRVIILPYEPREIVSAEDGILKKFGGRFNLDWKSRDWREGLELKIRLYEDRDEKGNPKQRLEMKPKISGDPALRLIWKF